MVATMKRKRQTKTFNRNSFKKRRTNGSITIEKALAIIAKSSGELKGVDIDIDDTSILVSTASNANCKVLNLMKEGNGTENRVGKKINIKSVRIKGVANYNYTPEGVTGNINAGIMRMVLVWDKQPNGVKPLYNKVFSRINQEGVETSEFLDNVNPSNTSRFSVLKDKIFQANPTVMNTSGGTTNAVKLNYMFDEYLTMNKDTIYDKTAGTITIANIATGALYLYYISNIQGTPGTWSITNGVSKLRYTD